jgi:hypothetical protein
MKRRLQIGVMGSAADLNYSKKLGALAFAVGKEVAKSGSTLMFGAEKDYDSLSTAAARGARSVGGLCVGVTYEKGLDIYDSADVVIATGLCRGGGREFSLVLSCDGIICLGGGSGTLNEMLVAYQASIPIVVVAGTGGWADELAGRYLDKRKRLKCIPAKNPKEAVKVIVEKIT